MDCMTAMQILEAAEDRDKRQPGPLTENIQNYLLRMSGDLRDLGQRTLLVFFNNCVIDREEIKELFQHVNAVDKKLLEALRIAKGKSTMGIYCCNKPETGLSNKSRGENDHNKT